MHPSHSWRPLLVALGLIWTAAQASQVSLSPVTLQLQPNVRATQLVLHNDGTQPVTFDLNVRAWTQQGGQDLLAQTQAVVAAPTTVTLPPGSSQTVRLARLGAPTLQELAYRLLLTERPSDAAGVRTRLQFSLPLFDGPASDTADTPAVPFQASRVQGDRVQLSNPGGVHLKLSSLEVQTAGVWNPVPLFYLLAGQSRLLDFSGIQALRYTSGGGVHDVAIR